MNFDSLAIKRIRRNALNCLISTIAITQDSNSKILSALLSDMKSKLNNVRRRVSHLTILLLTAFIFSCEEDDKVSPVFGTWTLTSADFTKCANGSNSTSTYFCDAQSCTKHIYAADGKMTIDQIVSGVKTVTEGTYEISGNSITINNSAFMINPQSWSFTVKDNSLSFSTPAEYTGHGCIYTQYFSK